MRNFIVSAIVCEYAIDVSVHAHGSCKHEKQTPMRRPRLDDFSPLSIIALHSRGYHYTNTHIRLAYYLQYRRPVTGDVITCDESAQIMAHVCAHVRGFSYSKDSGIVNARFYSIVNESACTHSRWEWLSDLVKYICACTHITEQYVCIL